MQLEVIERVGAHQKKTKLIKETEVNESVRSNPRSAKQVT